MEIIICTRNLDIDKLIRSVVYGLECDKKTTSIRSSNSLDRYISEKNGLVIFFDEELHREQSLENEKAINFSSILSKNRNNFFFFISNSNTRARKLSKLAESFYFLSKNNLNQYKLKLILETATKFDFFAISVDRLKINQIVDCDLFFAGKSKISTKIYIKRDTALSNVFFKRLEMRGISHLYVRTSDLQRIDSLESAFSIYKMWIELQKLLLSLLDDSGYLSTEQIGSYNEQFLFYIGRFEEIFEDKNLKFDQILKILLPRLHPVNIAINNLIIINYFINYFKSKVSTELKIVAALDFYSEYFYEEIDKEIVFKMLFEHFKKKGLLRSKDIIELYRLKNENQFGTGFPKGVILESKDIKYFFIRACRVINQKILVKSGNLETKISKDELNNELKVINLKFSKFS